MRRVGTKGEPEVGIKPAERSGQKVVIPGTRTSFVLLTGGRHVIRETRAKDRLVDETRDLRPEPARRTAAPEG